MMSLTVTVVDSSKKIRLTVLMLALQLYVSQLTLTTKVIYFVPNSSLWLVEFLWPMLFKFKI
jgi:hypothetical protein